MTVIEKLVVSEIVTVLRRGRDNALRLLRNEVRDMHKRLDKQEPHMGIVALNYEEDE